MSGITLKGVTNATIPTPASGKVTVFNSTDEGEPAYKDDLGAVTPLRGVPGADAPATTYLDHGNTGSTETVDASAGDVQRLVADAATVTITLTGWPASGTPGVILLWLEQDGTGGRDWAWPGAVDWGEAGEPTWTDRAGGEVDLVSLLTVDGGTTVQAELAGRAGPAGADGLAGGGISIDYTFDTTTADADPGAGKLRLDNATQSSSTTIRADLADRHGTTWTAVLATLADSTNTVKGHIRLYHSTDPTKWIVFTVSAVASPSGYKNITVGVVSSSSSSPFANADPVTLTFNRAGDKGSDGAGATADPSIAQGRLTLTTGVPITTSDVTAATTLYYTPFKGNLISTYSGSAWSTNPFTEKSISLAGLTAGLPYDVFIVDSTLALELLAWTNTTTRATALALQDGIYCKTGALTRRYLGTICIVATGQTEDSVARRMVWNAYHRVERPMKYVDTTDNWTYAVTAWQQMRGQSTAKVEFVIGLVEDAVKALFLHMIAGASGQAAAAGIGLDSATVNSAETYTEVSAGAAVTKLPATARYRGWPAVGYHYLAPLEYRRAGTCTFFGDDGVADQQTGLTAEVWA